MKNTNPVFVSADELVDINDVKVNKSLSKAERIAEFVRQIKNPYCFKCGDFIVKTRFSDNGLSMEDCLQSILL
ncbi:MAG: hypothetical protein PHV32_16430 [Eubacteriales bacterium]|nr:hypothetical protein [Eubacteriales bacterium]